MLFVAQYLLCGLHGQPSKSQSRLHPDSAHCIQILSRIVYKLFGQEDPEKNLGITVEEVLEQVQNFERYCRKIQHGAT